MELTMYLMDLADSDLFGTFAIICFIMAMTGLQNKIRNTKTHRTVSFCCLMFVPLLHGIGSYFLNQSVA